VFRGQLKVLKWWYISFGSTELLRPQCKFECKEGLYNGPKGANIASIICSRWHTRCILMALEVQSFFIYHNAGPIWESPLIVSKVRNILILLVLKFVMQQVPLRFAVSWKHSSYLKYSLKYFIFICFFFFFFFLSLFFILIIFIFFYPNHDQYDYLIYLKIYSSPTIFSLMKLRFCSIYLSL